MSKKKKKNSILVKNSIVNPIRSLEHAPGAKPLVCIGLKRKVQVKWAASLLLSVSKFRFRTCPHFEKCTLTFF